MHTEESRPTIINYRLVFQESLSHGRFVSSFRIPFGPAGRAGCIENSGVVDFDDGNGKRAELCLFLPAASERSFSVSLEFPKNNPGAADTFRTQS
ncbi:MAG TPA: hypothetical protein DD856_13505 [Sulfobacillus sp.]|nr:hypothetical protein [Sulfobacillus sp.]